MKILKEFILVIFSIIILGLAVTTIFIALDMFEINKFLDGILMYIADKKILVMGFSFALSLLALIGIFASSEQEENIKTGIAIKNDSGTVYISKDTFESIVLNVARSFGALRNIKVYVNLSEEGTFVNVYTYVLPDTVVTALTTKLQDNIKEAVLKQTSIDIKQVNVKVKGIYTQFEKKI